MELAYHENFALCEYTAIEAVALMPGISRKAIDQLLDIMEVKVEQSLPMLVRYTAFMDEFIDNGDWLLKIVPSTYLDLLLTIWDTMDVRDRKNTSAPGIFIDEETLGIINYFASFGMLNFQRGNPAANIPNRLYIVKEIKDAFYFQLKSKKTQDIIIAYEEWDIIIQGLLKIVGIMKLQDIRKQIERITSKEILSSEFFSFMRCRTSLWGLGWIYRDLASGELYFATNQVEDPQKTFQLLERCDIVNYKNYSIDNLVSIYQSKGVYSNYMGVHDLLTFLTEDLEMDYYRAMVFLIKLVSDIQNGCDFENVEEAISLVTNEMIEKPIHLKKVLEIIYQNIPIFHLKGHSYEEYQKISRLIEKEKMRSRFFIIR